MPKEKVLLIEDDEMARTSLKRIIEKEGYDTIVASDGDEGLEIFRRENPDIVVTDIKIPHIDGMQVLHTVKEVSPSTEVILVTAYGEYDTAIHALRQGALDYLKKPIDLNQLIISLDLAREKNAARKKRDVKTSLLILEDDEETRKRLERLFKKEGYEVFAGADGEEGINIFLEKKIDILLLDIKMPKKDGIKVLHTVRKLSKDCEAIMLTGYGDENTAIQAMREGAINYIRKPVTIEQLILAVKKAADKLRVTREYLYKARELQIAHEIIAKITENEGLVIELGEDSAIHVGDFALSVTNTIPLHIVFVDEEMNVRFVNRYFIESHGPAPKRLEEIFTEGAGILNIGFDGVMEGVRKAFNRKEPVIVTIDDEMQIAMYRVTLITGKRKGKRVLLIIRGEK